MPNWNKHYQHLMTVGGGGSGDTYPLSRKSAGVLEINNGRAGTWLTVTCAVCGGRGDVRKDHYTTNQSEEWRLCFACQGQGRLQRQWDELTYPVTTTPGAWGTK